VYFGLYPGGFWGKRIVECRPYISPQTTRTGVLTRTRSMNVATAPMVNQPKFKKKTPENH